MFFLGKIMLKTSFFCNADFVSSSVKEDIKMFINLLKNKKNALRFVLLLLVYGGALYVYPKAFGVFYFLSILYFYVLIGYFVYRDIILKIFLQPGAFINTILLNMFLVSQILSNPENPSPTVMSALICHIYILPNNALITLITTGLFFLEQILGRSSYVFQNYHPNIIQNFFYNIYYYNVKSQYSQGELLGKFTLWIVILASFSFKWIIYFVKWSSLKKRSMKHFKSSNMFSGAVLFLLILVTYKSFKHSPDEFSQYSEIQEESDFLA